jgi:hypothetical protein
MEQNMKHKTFKEMMVASRKKCEGLFICYIRMSCVQDRIWDMQGTMKDVEAGCFAREDVEYAGECVGCVG